MSLRRPPHCPQSPPLAMCFLKHCPGGMASLQWKALVSASRARVWFHSFTGHQSAWLEALEGMSSFPQVGSVTLMVGLTPGQG